MGVGLIRLGQKPDDALLSLVRALLQAVPTTPAPTGLSKEQQVIDLFHYIPNRALAILAAALFGGVSILILIVMLVKRRQYFMLVVTFCGLAEATGYVMRTIALDSLETGLYIGTQITLILPPTLLALANYIIAGRVMRISGSTRVGCLRASWVAASFFASDIICICIQGAGAAFLVKDDTDRSSSDLGKALILVGLIAQLAFFTAFLTLVLYMHFSRKFGLRSRRDMTPTFGCLYITTALLYIRGIFRCIEFGQGWDGYLASHEVYFYVFDSLPIFLAFVTYAALHSSVWLPDAPAHSARTAVSPAGDVAHLNGARFGGATSLQPPGSERMLKGSQV
mmetsp:Transcript_19147/g.57825  ORF Transcript_19147/g.57825 Transcript_19147/m.57825 type:complete len:338 (-) Transcript_19147:335-1348(-)